MAALPRHSQEYELAYAGPIAPWSPLPTDDSLGHAGADNSFIPVT